MPKKKEFPRTLDAAVEYCLKVLPVGTLKQVELLTDEDDTHFGLGLWIRNNLGLWRGNGVLMEALCCHPDDASGRIVQALTRYLQEHPDWRARRRALRAPRTKE